MKALELSQRFSHPISRRSRAANSTVQGLIWPNFEPAQDFMVVLVTCKNEEAGVVTTLFIDFKTLKGS